MNEAVKHRSITLTMSNGRAMTFNYLLGPDCAPVWGEQEGVIDAEVVQVMGRTIWPGDTVIDGGACYGYFTVILSKLVGDKGKVIAIEPGENNLPYLKQNLANNDCNNVKVVDMALWFHIGLVDFHLAKDGGGNSIADLGHTNVRTQVATATLRQFTPAKLSKLDLEGAEADVLTMLKGTDDALFVIAEINKPALAKFNQSQNSLRRVMQDRGYSMFLMPMDGQMPVLVPDPTRLCCTRANVNVLFSTPHIVGCIWSLIAI